MSSFFKDFDLPLFSVPGAPETSPVPQPKAKPAPRPAQPRPQPQPRQQQAPAGRGDGWQAFNPHAALAAASQQEQRMTDALGVVNDAVSKEMNSRKQIAQAERERQHELQLEYIRQQGESQKAEAARQAAMNAQAERAARHNALSELAGMGPGMMGGQTIRTDGQGGVFVSNPMDALRRSLLG